MHNGYHWAVSNRSWFAVAAIGRDRPGIVADLSECVYECDCNLEDTSMTMLGSEFATLMLVSSIAEDAIDRLRDTTKRLEWERRLTIFIRPLEAPPAAAGTANRRRLRLTAMGVDKAGIVAGVARTLADAGILIEDLRSKVDLTPQSGTQVYTLSIRMSAPEELDMSALETALERVGNRLDVEIRLEPEAPAPTV